MFGRCHIILVTILQGALLAQAADDCSILAESGDCDFYKCVDDILPCGNDSYASGFGDHFCRGPQHVNGLTSEAMDWFTDVQRCIMGAMLPHYSDINIECDDITEIAIYAQIDCFSGTDIGSSINKTLTFCRVVADLDNWKALLNIFKAADKASSPIEAVKSIGKSASVTLKDASSKCFGMGKDLFKNITNAVGTARTLLTKLFDLQPIAAEPSGEDCMALANVHNCSFFECFERRFPCKRHHGLSHVLDFELTSCREFYKELDTFDKQGQAWLGRTQTCLMTSLEPLLNASTLHCHDLHSRLFKARLRCYVDSGFCNITDDTPNRWAIDRSLQGDNFPVARSLKPGLDLIASNYYHQEVMLLQRISGYANLLCFKDNVKYHLRKLYGRIKTKLGFMNFERVAKWADKIKL
ncbi:hypothetical protein LSAT2_027791 [Lamellibrachia satsuma]|nr:hypothetical protein LSAT2_027791 [Lamellibrachia satsuma]